MLTIRTMTVADIGVGLELCRLAGWNQLEPDWQRLLALAPDGVFIAEEDGRPCGSGSTTVYGNRTAWIGMILVHPAFRNRGIGTAIMNKCIEHLQSKAVESIKLDATDLGRPVYLKLGFLDERPIHRYAGKRPRGVAAHRETRAIAADDWPAIGNVDRMAFDADRLDLLRILSGEAPAAVISDSGRVRGYGFARRGYNASFVGPAVATDADAARAIVETLLAGLPDGEVFWDVLPDNTAGKELAESLGLTVARRLVRMYLGSHVHPGDVNLVYGAAGFELG
jgi:GNAT superfamily N-acetyltransferase